MGKHSLWRILLVLVLVLLVMSPVSAAGDVSVSDFRDMPSETNWAFDGIVYCVENGIMVGKSKTTFAPDATLTRAELATVLYRLDGSPAVDTTSGFSDVSSGDWFYKSVTWASEKGIVKGYTDGSFKPNASVTRQELATMFYRYMGEPSVSGSLDFPDAGSVNNYAKTPMTWAVQSGLIYGSKVNGQVLLTPTATATRSQIATILMRFCTKLVYEVSLDAYEGLDDYDVSRRIATDYNRLIEPYLSSGGQLPNDEATISDAGNVVYEWAKKLEAAGYIAGCSHNETGDSVAFFLHDGSTSLYLPPVEDCCSGPYDYTVSGITTLTLTHDAVVTTFTGTGADESAEYIGENAPEYTQVETPTRGTCTVPYLRDYFGSLDENNVRAIFWRSHGGVYTDSNGVERVCFVLSEKITEDKDETYEEYLNSSGNVSETVAEADKYYAVTSNFFQQYMSQVDGGLFYSGACCSAADGGVAANIFFDKGFQAYVGADGKIFTFYSDDYMEAVAQALCEMDDYGDYSTILDAFLAARYDVGLSDYAGISMILRENDDEVAFRLADPPGYKLAYEEVLREKHYGSGNKFQLVFIDDNDIPELMVSCGFHHSADVHLYTYYDGEAKYLGNFAGNYGVLTFSERNNSVVSSYMQMGVSMYQYFEIKDGELKQVAFFEKRTTGGKTTYYVNEVPVLEAVYNAWVEQVHGDKVYIDRGYNGLSATDKDIKKMIRDWDNAIVK